MQPAQKSSKASERNSRDRTELNLNEVMTSILAKHPEWRFLEQQRCLKDIIRLLIRDTESHSELALKQKALTIEDVQVPLTSSWLSLLIAQELQLPPQLTRHGFTYTFYATLAGESNLLLDTHFSQQISEDTFSIVKLVHLFCQELIRIQTEYFDDDKPWHCIRPCIQFLNHRLPLKWINCVDELLLLLEQHDSLITQRNQQQKVEHQQLHTSHPIRKKAVQDAQHQANFLSAIHQNLQNSEEALNLFLKKKISEHQHYTDLVRDIDCIQRAWTKTNILYPDRIQNFEQLDSLFSEARQQQQDIRSRYFPALQHTLENNTSKEEKYLCHILYSLFEVPYESES